MTANSFLNQLTAQSQELVANSLVTMFVFDYNGLGQALPIGSSKFGGSAAIAPSLIPTDKTGSRMNLLAQINFADLSSFVDSSHVESNESRGSGSIPLSYRDERTGELSSALPYPTTGVLMLFVSPQYQAFKAKDASWYKLIYLPESRLLQPQVEGGLQECALSVNCLQFVPEERRERLLSGLEGEDAVRVLDWFSQSEKGWSRRLSEGQQLLFANQNELTDWRRAGTVAAFHANGISFDKDRERDPHYKHLVDAAADWIAIWRISGLADRIAERRALYVCIRRENLIELEFLNGCLVFL